MRLRSTRTHRAGIGREQARRIQVKQDVGSLADIRDACARVFREWGIAAPTQPEDRHGR